MIVMPRIYDHGEKGFEIRLCHEGVEYIFPLTVNEAAGLIIDLAEPLARRARVPLNRPASYLDRSDESADIPW